MDVEKLTTLIRYFSEFSQEAEGLKELDSFAYWLLKKVNKPEVVDEIQLNRDIGYQINRINRYGKYLSKHFLEETSISSLDEFSFLTAIKMLGKPSKTEVYQTTVTELTTGQQMMRRLIKLELVAEETDEIDKRMKRVMLTEKGLKTQAIAFEQIGKECNLKFGGLDIESKKALFQTLKELDRLNAIIFMKTFSD